MKETLHSLISIAAQAYSRLFSRTRSLQMGPDRY